MFLYYIQILTLSLLSLTGSVLYSAQKEEAPTPLVGAEGKPEWSPKLGAYTQWKWQPVIREEILWKWSTADNNWFPTDQRRDLVAYTKQEQLPAFEYELSAEPKKKATEQEEAPKPLANAKGQPEWSPKLGAYTQWKLHPWEDNEEVLYKWIPQTKKWHDTDERRARVAYAKQEQLPAFEFVPKKKAPEQVQEVPTKLLVGAKDKPEWSSELAAYTQWKWDSGLETDLLHVWNPQSKEWKNIYIKRDPVAYVKQGRLPTFELVPTAEPKKRVIEQPYTQQQYPAPRQQLAFSQQQLAQQVQPEDFDRLVALTRDEEQNPTGGNRALYNFPTNQFISYNPTEKKWYYSDTIQGPWKESIPGWKPYNQPHPAARVQQ